jgi:creatinine amidohydrolase
VALALLPLGAVEKHGPHLPLDTDTILAEALARRCARALDRGPQRALVTGPFAKTAASFAADFPGTVSVPAGAERVVLVNLHFDPEHMRAVKAAVAELEAKDPGRTVFPDFTRRVNAQRIGGEFATGACHAGEFETSLMLAVAPGTVHPSYVELPAREVNLAQAIREGKRSFRELGLDEAYCGHPATATAQEGDRLLGILATIILEDCRDEAPRSPR